MILNIDISLKILLLLIIGAKGREWVAEDAIKWLVIWK